MVEKHAENIRFGQRIAELRKSHGFSQEELALRSGINRTFMGAIERGEKGASLRTICKLAQAFGLTLKDFFDYE